MSGPLVLRSLPSGGVLCRTIGSDDVSLAFIESQRDSWWINARHYCGDALVIEEEHPSKPRNRASTNARASKMLTELDEQLQV